VIKLCWTKNKKRKPRYFFTWKCKCFDSLLVCEFSWCCEYRQIGSSFYPNCRTNCTNRTKTS